jgi:hypothetical protein
MFRESSVNSSRTHVSRTNGSMFNLQKINEASVVTEQISSDLSRITEEDRYLAMLGYKDLNREQGTGGVMFYREEFCGGCGIIHSNPDVLDCFTNCLSCYSVIREPAVLRRKYAVAKQDQPFQIFFATYGDPFDPSSNIIVTTLMQERLKEFTSLDRLVIKPNEDMAKTFGEDPCNDRNKQLRIRYRLHEGGGHGTLMLDFQKNNRIPQTFFFIVPKISYLRIYSASYGHPKGSDKGKSQ